MAADELMQRYEVTVRGLRRIVERMEREGADQEAIARAAHAERLAIAMTFKDLTAEPLRSALIERTVATYGNPAGPSIEFLRERGKSWGDIIESAIRPGPLPV